MGVFAGGKNKHKMLLMHVLFCAIQAVLSYSANMTDDTLFIVDGKEMSNSCDLQALISVDPVRAREIPL